MGQGPVAKGEREDRVVKMDWSNYLSQYGQGSDSLVAHINPEEAEILKSLGGSGTINPQTGLLQFEDDDDASARDTSASDTSGTYSSGSHGFGGYGGYAAGNKAQTGGPSGTGVYGEGPTGAWGSAAHSNYTDLGFWDSVMNFWDELDLMDIVMAGLTIIANPPLGVASMAFKKMTGINPSLATPAKEMIGMVVNNLDKINTPEQIAATKTEYDRSVRESISGISKGLESGRGFEVASSSVGNEMMANDKSLDALLKKFGEVGDYNSAMSAVKTYEDKAGMRTKLEQEIYRFSGDPDFQKIEPELRIMADAALEKGMDPKSAVDSAFKAVKEAYLARKYVKELIDSTRKKLEAAA